MATRTNRIAKNTRYAVIRCYQPARIERELLVQVFDLAGRRSDARYEPGDEDLEPMDMEVQGLDTVGVVASHFSTNSLSPITTLEEAA